MRSLALALSLAPVIATAGDFTFKRAGPLAAGAKRITVQIAPGTPTVLPAPDPPPSASHRDSVAARPAGDPFARYWSLVSPDLVAADADRLDGALAALDAGGVPGARRATMERLADAWGAEIMAATAGMRVSPALILAVMSVESAGRADAVSHAGATGLMQLMPATAARFGVADIAAPDQNIRGGTAYLDWLLGKFRHDPVLTLAAYNAGEGAVARSTGVPPYAETRAYVPKVLAAWTVARSLCSTPPAKVTEPCVFVRRSAAVSSPAGG